MNRREIAVVFRKELRETLRDRRTLAVMVLLPLVVYPLVSLLSTEVLAAKRMETEARPSRVAVAGADAAAVAGVRAALGRSKEIALVPGPSDDGAVTAGRVDATVRVGAAAPATGARRVRIFFDQTREPSSQAHARVEAALTAALPPGCAPSYAVDSANLAPRKQIGAYILSKILPLLVVLMTMLGAFYPAIDITAGERERGTLETLLAAPVDRIDLMAGKVLAVATLAALTGLLNIASMSLTVSTGTRLMGAVGLVEIPWTRAAATVMTVVPAAFLFASVMVAVGALARSFKEAQSLLTPLYFLCLVPSLVAGLGDFPLRGAALLVPGVNVTLLARDVMIGDVTAIHAALVIASTLVYGAAALALAARLYDSERLLAVSDADRSVPLRSWLGHLLGFGAGAPRAFPQAGPRPPLELRPQAEPASAWHAVLLFFVAWVLWFFVFSELQRWRLIPGLLLSQWIGFGGLVWIYARLCRRPLGEVVGLTRPRGWSLAGATLVGASSWLLLGFVAEHLLPPPPHLIEEMRKLIRPPDGDRPLALSLFALAVTPAICEEALFRGPILRGLAQRLPATWACLITGALFGLLHGDVWRFLPTTVLGTALSALTLASGSIVPAMLAHLLNNGALVLLGYLGFDQPGQAVRPAAEVALLCAAGLAVTLGVLAIRRGRTAR